MKISVNTKPNSFVGLLGVDQSVLLLKKGNDIEPSDVTNELEEYNRPTKYNYEWYNDMEAVDYYRRYDDFDESDVLIMTNAKKQFGEFF